MTKPKTNEPTPAKTTKGSVKVEMTDGGGFASKKKPYEEPKPAEKTDVEKLREKVEQQQVKPKPRVWKGKTGTLKLPGNVKLVLPVAEIEEMLTRFDPKNLVEEAFPGSSDSDGPFKRYRIKVPDKVCLRSTGICVDCELPETHTAKGVNRCYVFMDQMAGEKKPNTLLVGACDVLICSETSAGERTKCRDWMKKVLKYIENNVELPE